MSLPRGLKISRKQEKQTSRDLGGRVQPGSGSVRNPYFKEDTNSEHVLCQCKATDKGSFILKRSEFDTTEEHALRQSKMPAWRITFQDQTDVAVLRWQDFLALLKDAGMG